MSKLALTLSLMLLASLVACGDGGDAQISPEIVDAISAHLRAEGLDGHPEERQLKLPGECLKPGDLCLALVSLSGSDALVRLHADQSDAVWEMRLQKEDAHWAVVGVAYTGCCP